MNRVVLQSCIDEHGVLHLSVPMGKAEANQQVQVTIDPLPKPATTPEKWRQFVISTAGGWQGELERPAQGEYEERDLEDWQ